jgi:hypothetical protein
MIAQKARLMTKLVSLLRKKLFDNSPFIEEVLTQLDILTLERGIKVCVEDQLIVVYLPSKPGFNPIPVAAGVMHQADVIFEYEAGTGRIVKCLKHRERNPEEFNNV